MTIATQTSKELVLGAVAYDAKVVPIWEGFRAYFQERGLPFDFVLYSNYERQVEAHLRGEIDVAWNSPLAWIETERAARARGRAARAIAMRDTDRDLTSVVLVRSADPIREIADLRGKRIGVGAADSPQATLIPLEVLAEAGLEVDAIGDEASQIVRHDVLVGKHGDHIGGERLAVEALLAGTVDAACVIDGNHVAFTREGLIGRNQVRVLVQTPLYDHCNFTVLDAGPSASAIDLRTPSGSAARPSSNGLAIDLFRELLFSMSYEDPRVRPLLDLEGLKAWCPGRTSGYALLERAVDRFGTLRDWLAGSPGRAR